MYELLSKFDPGALFGLAALVGGLVCGTAVAIVAIVMGNWRGIRRAELALKNDMLERGMTAEEIRIVMEAGSKNSGRPGKSPVDAEL